MSEFKMAADVQQSQPKTLISHIQAMIYIFAGKI